MVTKKKLILPLFIVFLMVFSIFGVVIGEFGDSVPPGGDFAEKINYEGYDFVFDGNKWSTIKDNQKIEFLTDPRELGALYTGDLVSKIFNYKKIYLTMLPEIGFDSEREVLRQILVSLTGVPVINACPDDVVGCEENPLKDCQDAIEGDVLVIKIENGDEWIQEEGSCIAIIGDSQHLIKIIDKVRLEAIL